ncbi:multidrug resistance protein D [Microbacterium azadirachtae]|uniref:Multidrug resistance protein D n=1 Tax=Microbacterium azadirachtae TaxID=582680 RepID=A0A0F0KZ84_9MICO|nr:multidrug resistance protein D [Microbacterium azadirachtae]
MTSGGEHGAVTTTTASLALPSARRLPHHAGFWIIAVAFLTQMAFCAIPTPLYAIYQQRDGFPTIVLTVIFVSYAVGVMVSLYLAGHVSDWLGRRRVILGSLLINVLSAVLFLVWTDVTGLIIARFVCGLGVGILTATATAHLSELGAAAGRPAGRSALVSTFANLGGISLGPLVGGVVATWAARPLVTPYAIFAVLLAVEAVVVAFVPETVERREERPAYRPQRVAVPAAGRSAFWSAAAAAFGAFAVFGTFMGLSSTFLGRVLGVHSPLLVGVAPFILFMAAAAAQILTTTVPARAQLLLAIVLAVLGLAAVAAGAVLTSLSFFLIGAGTTGAGIGILFRNALTTAASAAMPERRGEALAAIFLIAYAGMTLPPLLAAGALSIWSPVTVLIGLSALAGLLVVVSGARMTRR